MLRKDIKFDRPGPAIVQADIDRVTAALGGIQLPQEYERYMLRLNGAAPDIVLDDRPLSQLLRVWWPVGSPCADDGHGVMLGEMHQIDVDPKVASDLLTTHRDIAHLLPPSSIAFANSAGGGRFLFDLRPDRFGEVLHWSYLHLAGAEMLAQQPYHNVSWVARDFIDFLNRIEIEPANWDNWEAALPPDSDLDWRPE